MQVLLFPDSMLYIANFIIGSAEGGSMLTCIGLYRENAIAIESEARDPFGGNE